VMGGFQFGAQIAKARTKLGMQAQGLVMLHCPPSRKLRAHEWATHAYLARRIAALTGHEFGGAYDSSVHYAQPLYFVPSDTLLRSEADGFGIEDESQLFGGVVPCAFVATKAITHALVHGHAAAPAGWSSNFCE